MILYLKSTLIFLTLIVCSPLYGQMVQIKVQNAAGEGVPDATITVNNNNYNTNAGGEISQTLPIGNYVIYINAKGYNTLKDTLKIIPNNNTYTFILLANRNIINAYTMSGSRFKKRAAEEVVSIEIIKPEFINNAGINRIDEALNKMPGVDVIDNQINIRGGAGWSYGAGSRVMVLLDDMPMLSADAQDAKWDFMPIESCEQIEVLKGAAGALYGSSALNGVVHFRTAYAKKQPVTKFQMYNGIFGNPARKELVWWAKNQPTFYGGYASHSRKIGNTDLVAGAAWFAEDSYLQGDVTRRARFNVSLRHKVKNVPGLVLTLNSNLQKGKTSTFFLHQADTS